MVTGFISRDVTGRPRICGSGRSPRADVAERDAQPLLGAGIDLRGLEPIESPEGGTVYYMPLQSSAELWSVSPAGGAPRKVIGSGIKFGWWTPAPGGMYYVDLTKVFCLWSRHMQLFCIST
jgi:hypothetical protein